MGQEQQCVCGGGLGWHQDVTDTNTDRMQAQTVSNGYLIRACSCSPSLSLFAPVPSLLPRSCRQPRRDVKRDSQYAMVMPSVSVSMPKEAWQRDIYNTPGQARWKDKQRSGDRKRLEENSERTKVRAGRNLCTVLDGTERRTDGRREGRRGTSSGQARQTEGKRKRYKDR